MKYHYKVHYFVLFSYNFIGDNLIKRMSLKKLTICIIAIISIFLFYLFPTNNKLKLNEELEYINDEKLSTIFLNDSNNYLAMASIDIDDKNITNKARKLITALIQDEKYEDKIPNGFQSIIPSSTKILNAYFKDGVFKIDFSKDLLDTTKDNEQKIIESIVYTLTSINDIKYVIIYIEGEILTKLPKSNIILPATLDRSLGINKEYDIDSNSDITKTTIYYINKYNGQEYYVPVTKVNNDTREKAEIIIEELSLNKTYNNHLMSYLNTNTKIVNINKDTNNIILDFNNYIYDDYDTNKILDEVIKQVCLSIKDNYDTKKIVFTVNSKEIYKTT